jgi:hypothetical protein
MSPRNTLTNDQKRTICLCKQNNPLIKDKEIGNNFSKIFNLEKFGNNFFGLNNVDFKYSLGWLSNFKERFGISFHVVYDEYLKFLFLF